MEQNTDDIDSSEEMPAFSHFITQGAEVDASKRRLPHWQFDEGLYFVTWRLADSLPQSLLRQWAEEKRIWLHKHPRPWDYGTGEEYRREFPQRMQDWLDAGYGACVLRNPACTTILADVMRRFEGDRYDIASFVIMPNHVHALFQLRGVTNLKPLLKAWKGTSAREINKRLGQSGVLWSEESRDTSIRNTDHLVRCYAYIRENPEKATLREGEYLYYELPGLQRQIRAWSGDVDE